MTDVLIYRKGKFGHRQPHREGRQCEETERRQLCDFYISQGIPRIVSQR